MGWWDDKHKSKKVVIGDEPLDSFGNALRSVAELYQDAWQRKPSAAELTRLLELALRGAGDELCSDAIASEVRVTYTLKRLPVRQSFGIGDYFAIPLKKGRFGYGRILWNHPVVGLLVETYDLVSVGLANLRQVKSGRRVFCTHVSPDGFKSRRWRIIASAPLRLKQAELPIFSRVGAAGGYLMQGERRIRRTSVEEAEQYYTERLESEESFEREFQETLSGRRSYRF